MVRVFSLCILQSFSPLRTTSPHDLSARPQPHDFSAHTTPHDLTHTTSPHDLRCTTSSHDLGPHEFELRKTQVQRAFCPSDVVKEHHIRIVEVLMFEHAMFRLYCDGLFDTLTHTLTHSLTHSLTHFDLKALPLLVKADGNSCTSRRMCRNATCM